MKTKEDDEMLTKADEVGRGIQHLIILVEAVRQIQHDGDVKNTS